MYNNQFYEKYTIFASYFLTIKHINTTFKAPQDGGIYKGPGKKEFVKTSTLSWVLQLSLTQDLWRSSYCVVHPMDLLHFFSCCFASRNLNSSEKGVRKHLFRIWRNQQPIFKTITSFHSNPQYINSVFFKEGAKIWEHIPVKICCQKLVLLKVWRSTTALLIVLGGDAHSRVHRSWVQRSQGVHMAIEWAVQQSAWWGNTMHCLWPSEEWMKKTTLY